MILEFCKVYSKAEITVKVTSGYGDGRMLNDFFIAVFCA